MRRALNRDGRRRRPHAGACAVWLLAALGGGTMLQACTSGAPLPPDAAATAAVSSSAAAPSSPPRDAQGPHDPLRHRSWSSFDLDRVVALLPADVLLFGEQHDSADHHRIERDLVEALAARRVLAAVVLEMAEHGRSTRSLAHDARDADAQAALGWSEQQWPWRDYGPAVMAALRARVPVLGANLPRAQMRAAMADAALDASVPEAALAAQREAIRGGHCGLLPEAQIAPMTRIQLARDRSIARAIEAARVPGKTVLLIAGAGHARRDLGVPLHLDRNIDAKVALALTERSGLAADLLPSAASDGARVADVFLLTPALPPKDHCAALRG